MGWRDKLHIFRFWSQKVLPQVYDDALSYYEVLNKIADFLNQTIEKINELIDEQESFEEEMTQKWNTFKLEMEQAWEAFKDEMDDEWKAYKTLMETEWEDFKDTIESAWEDFKNEMETDIEDKFAELTIIFRDEIQDTIDGVINDLKDELMLYIDGTRTVVVHITGNPTTGFTCDKTYQQIVSIITEGGYVVAEYNNQYFLLLTTRDTIQSVDRLEFSTIAIVSSELKEYIFYIANNNNIIWVTQTYEALPSYSTTDAQKVLAVDNSGTGLEWVNQSGGSGLPSYTTADAEKILAVNNSGTGLEWINQLNGQDVMIVHFVDRSYAGSTPPVHTCDKTFAEVVAHIENGKPVLGIHTNTFPTGATTEGTTITLYYCRQLPYTGADYSVIEFASNSLGVTQNGSTTDYTQCIGNIIRLLSNDTFTVLNTSGYTIYPHGSAVGKYLKYSAIGVFDFDDVYQVPLPTQYDTGRILKASGSGSYGWEVDKVIIDIQENATYLPSGYDYTDIRNMLVADPDSVILRYNYGQGAMRVYRCSQPLPETSTSPLNFEAVYGQWQSSGGSYTLSAIQCFRIMVNYGNGLTILQGGINT